jgi:hypothetical protein
MNQNQRSYLTKWVTDNFDKEKKAVKEKHFERPDLNNYLVAAALSGTLQVHSADEIAAYVKEVVTTQGKDKILVTYKDKSSRYYDDDYSRDGKHTVTLEAERVFVIPEEYGKRLIEWEENEKQIKAELDHLEGIKDTVLLKVNIGSDKALEEIITQADSLATLDLINKQISGGGQKQLTAKK